MNAERNHRRRTLWLCGGLHAFTHLYQVALMPLYLPIQADFRLASVGQATLLLTVMMAAYFLPSYPMGLLADTMSRKKLLTIGLALNGLGFVGLGLAPNYAFALGCVVLAGFGGSFFHPAATAMVARLFPVGTGKALGLLGIGASIGFFAGPLYAGWRADTAGWRAPVLELGALGLVGAALFAWLADEERPAPEASTISARSHPMFPQPVLWAFFLGACAAFSLRDFTGASMGSLGSLFLQKAHGFGLKETGLALSTIFIMSVVSNPLFGGLSDRGRFRWLASVLVVSALLVALFPRVPRGWVVPAFMLYGFFFLASFPMTEAAVMEAVPDSVRGRVFGSFITVGGLVSNLSHWIMGGRVQKLGGASGSPEAFYSLYAGLAVLVVLSLLGLPCLRALRRREQVLEAAPLREAVPAKPPSPWN
jgi:MFS family permease